MTSLWIGGAPLLLASTSRTRRALLESAGIPIETQSPGIDERAVEAAAMDLPPLDLARRLASEKSLAVSRAHPERIVLGADQVLDCGDKVFHKPVDRAAARRQLQALSGRTHRLHSAGALAKGGEIVAGFAVIAHLTMRALDDDAINLYLDLAGPEVLNSVGVYHYEGLGVHLFERVEGDHSTILGLPLLPLVAALRRLGYLAF
nr:Maf family protein [Microvirga terricola]